MTSNRNPQHIDRSTERWTITPRTLEEADRIALLKQAGVQPHEVARLAGEIVTSLSGVKKLAALTPDQAHAAAFVAFCERVARRPTRA